MVIIQLVSLLLVVTLRTLLAAQTFTGIVVLCHTHDGPHSSQHAQSRNSEKGGTHGKDRENLYERIQTWSKRKKEQLSNGRRPTE